MSYTEWLNGLAPEQMIQACGKADCGCVYHVEEGIPCEHDYAFAMQIKAAMKACDAVIDHHLLMDYVVNFPEPFDDEIDCNPI